MHHYDDPNYNYQNYWQNRDYEHQSELIAINKLLSVFRCPFSKIADVGGGFGRHYQTFSPYARQIYLIEPSLKHRQLAKKLYPKLLVKHGFSHKLPFKSKFLDLVSLIRVSHHLPDLAPAFTEINRVLKPNGYFLLEFANSANFKTRLHHLFSPLPKVPIERRSQANIERRTIAFVNHHPQTVLSLLKNSGFTVERTLSVSNFRSPFLKNIIPIKILLFLESSTQHLGSNLYFGPSIIILAKKA